MVARVRVTVWLGHRVRVTVSVSLAITLTLVSRQIEFQAVNPKGNFQHSIKHEPRHDKTNKMSVRPAKTKFSLGEDSDQTGRTVILLVLSCRGSIIRCNSCILEKGRIIKQKIFML